MARSVVITTPVPTWQEMADFYGLSKSDRRFVERLFEPANGVKAGATGNKRLRAKSAAKSNGTRRFTGKTNGRARKTA